jgi:serine protease Do
MSRYKVFAAASAIAAMLTAAIIYAPRAYGQTPDARPAIAAAQTPTPAPAPPAERAPFAYRFGAGSEIGVTVRDIEKTTGPSSGAVVEDVRPNSPAERAGVKASDVIAEFDGERVRSARQFSRLVEETPDGRTVKMMVMRNGQRVTMDVTPEARQFGRVMPIAPHLSELPDMSRLELQIRPQMENLEKQLRDLPEITSFAEAYAFGNGRLGLQVQTLNEQLAQYFGVKHGALVASVGHDSAAAKAGLKAGDVITSLNGTAIENTSDVRRALRSIDEGKDFSIEVMRDKKPLSLKGKLEPRERPGTRTEVF